MWPLTFPCSLAVSALCAAQPTGILHLESYSPLERQRINSVQVKQADAPKPRYMLLFLFLKI